MDTPVRLSPSGPVIKNSGGGGLQFGPGASLRLSELQSVMTGSQAVPTVTGVINSDGFGGATPLRLSLANAKAGLNYRADLRLDLINPTTSHAAAVTLFLESSVDNGVTWTVQAKNAHTILPQLGVTNPDNGQARECSLAMPLRPGSGMGVVDGVTTGILLRASAVLSVGAAGDLLVDSSATSGAQTGLNGTIYMQLEECF